MMHKGANGCGMGRNDDCFSLIFLCNLSECGNDAALQLRGGFPIGALCQTDVSQPKLIGFAVFSGQGIKLYGFPVACENLTHTSLCGDGKTQTIGYGFACVKCAFQIAGVYCVHLISRYDIVSGDFSLLLTQIGQGAINVSNEYAIQIGLALSVTNDEKFGHNKSYLCCVMLSLYREAISS